MPASPRSGVFPSMRDLTARTALVTGVEDLSDVRMHADASAAEAAAAVGARAFACGRDIYFGPNELRTDTASGQRLIAHELAHVAQQRQIGARVQRQPTTPILQYSAALSILALAATGSQCEVFATDEEAERVEHALGIILLPAERTLFGSEVAGLYADYLSRRPGDSLAPVVFASPASKVVQGFRNSYSTLAHQRDYLMLALWAVLPDHCATLPADAWLDLSVAQLFPQFVLEQLVNWDRAFDLPANIAGGVGHSDAGLDTRRLSGSVAFLRTTDSDARTVGIRVAPHFHLTVTDAIDFCPGDPGAILERLFTIPMSRLEESGHAYDRPFIVEFDVPAEPVDAPQAVVGDCGGTSPTVETPWPSTAPSPTP